MDLNDPRRRLQVLNSTSPSLRVATAPKQTLRVAQAPQQSSAPLRVTGIDGKTPVNRSTPLPPPAANPLVQIGQFAQGANEAFLGGATKSIADTINWIGSGGNMDEAARRTNEFLHSTKQLNSEGNFNASAEGANRDADAFKLGQAVGQGEKIATEIATAAIPGAGVEKAATGVMKAQGVLQGAGKGIGLLRNAVPAVAGGIVSSGINQVQDPEQNLAQNLGTGAAIDAGASLLGPLGSTASRLFGGTASKLKGFFGGGDVVNTIIKSNDPAAIKQTLNVSDDIATYLAGEKNPETVKGILQALSVDPNIQLSENVRKRLQEEGISRVEKKDTEYGAEYQDGSIRFKDQSFATDDNAYHELGHHIFQTKLTPEEKALFKGEGAASKSAVGREGYTQDDVNSEDFSDFMRLALTGRIAEVPASVRGVIAKYAKVADDAAEEIKATPTDLPQEYKEAITEAGATLPKVELPATPTQAKLDNAELTTIPKANIKAEDIAATPQAAKTEVVPEEITEGVSKSNTGTADGTVDGSGQVDTLIGKDTSPEEVQAVLDGAKGATTSEKGIKFRDPATKKQVQRSYDDVEAELTTLKNKTELTSADNARIKTLETKMARFRSENAKYAFPDADEPTQKAVQEIMDQLNPASRAFNKAEKARSAERGARIGQGGNNFEAAGGGEAGFRAKLSALKGRYKESDFNPITASKETQDTLLNDIEKSNLRDFEKLNTQKALRKIWGMDEGKPTPSDINSIRKYFGEDMANAVQEAVDESPKSWRDKLTDIAGLPRAAMASFDFSMGLRQGGQVMVRNPKEWFNANKESAKYAANTKYYEAEMRRISDDDAFELISDKLGVRLPAVEGMSDEVMASAHILEKIPVYGKGISASDRAYSGGLSKLRFNIAKQWIDSVGGIDEFAKKFSDKEMKDIGEVINTSTGSGGKPGGFTEKHMAILSQTLFAPRLWASRLNSLNPVYYARLAPAARKRALENMGSFLGAMGGVVALANMAGAEVEMDPRSSDFMKIKVGNTRYDVFGGLQQNAVFFARMITGEKKNSSTGEIATLGEGFGQPNRMDLAYDMLQNKLNPLLGFASRLLQSADNQESDNPLERKDKFGEDMNIAAEGADLAIPLGVQGLRDTTADTGNFGQAAAMNIPNFFGVGTQTYGDVATKDKGTNENGKLVFKGKVTDDMVLDDNGQPYLDDKGRPVKAKFEEGATALEKKAILEEKARSEKVKAFEKNLSSEDRALMKLEEDELDGYLKDGDIDQAKYDKIMDLKSEKAIVNGVKVDKNIKSDNARRFYEKYNSLSKSKREAWLNGPASENSKQIASLINKDRSEGLSEFKPSQKLSKLYADYEKDINSHPDYTEVDKRNKAKAFQVSAYKLNYTADQSDIYNEGGSSDLRTLINEQQINKADLDEAIKMDNELYASGLTGTLKFSKKFRGEFGYSVPSSRFASGGSGGGRSGRGGRSGDTTQRAQLDALIPSTSGAKAESAPTISSKRRTQGVTFKNVNTPSKGTSKKISINL